MGRSILGWGWARCAGRGQEPCPEGPRQALTDTGTGMWARRKPLRGTEGPMGRSRPRWGQPVHPSIPLSRLQIRGSASVSRILSGPFSCQEVASAETVKPALCSEKRGFPRPISSQGLGTAKFYHEDVVSTSG